MGGGGGGGCPDGVVSVLGRCPMWYMLGLCRAMLGRCWFGAGSVSVSGRCLVGAGSVPNVVYVGSMLGRCWVGAGSMGIFVNLCADF